MMRRLLWGTMMMLVAVMNIGATPVQAKFPAHFLEEEAGMAAYFTFPGPTNLQSNLLRNLFRTISMQTDTYLVGFIPVEGFENANSQDVKVFIHNAGWVVAYYPKTDPLSKMYKEGTTVTRLQRTLDRVAASIEAVSYQVHYHHFQYPDATQLMQLHTRSSGAKKTIDFRLPGTNAYYERSWYMSAWGLFASGDLFLDGLQIGHVLSSLDYKTIPAEALVPNAKHIIEFTGYLAGADLFFTILYSGQDPLIVNNADWLTYIPLPALPAELELAAADVPFFLDFYLPLVKR